MPTPEPLADIRKTFRVDWYRCPTAPGQLRDLMRRSDAAGAVQAVGHLALFAATGLLTYFFFTRQIWLGFALALFAHGTVGSFFGGLAGHELSHGTVFKTKVLNQIFLRIFSVLGWWNFYEYAMSHTYHHRYTLHPRGDREVPIRRKPSLHPAYLLQLFTFNVFGGAESHGFIPVLRANVLAALGQGHSEWIRALYADQPAALRAKATNWARFVLAFHFAILVISIVSQTWMLTVLLSLHIFIGNWLKYFVGLPMHCGLQHDVADFRKCVRTITLDPVSEFLYWHMNWHTEHHMFAGVPCYNLAKLHAAVAHDMPQPRTLVGAWREMRETWRQQQADPSYAYDTPTPTPATVTPATVTSATVTDDQDSLAASIGDIAPDELR